MTRVRITVTILLVLFITNTIVVDKSVQYILYNANFSESIGSILNNFSLFFLVESVFSLVFIGMAFLVIEKAINANLKDYIEKSKGMLLALLLYVLSIYIMHADFHYTLALEEAENSTAGIAMIFFGPASAALVSLLFITASVCIFLKNTLSVQSR